MTWNVMKLLTTLCLLQVQSFSYATPSYLFNVSSTGAAGPISITLCLNATAELSCQRFTVSSLNLSISTTIPHKTYPDVGIKVNTPGYEASGCTMLTNGMCSFSANNDSVTSIMVESTHSSPGRLPRFAYMGSWGGDSVSVCAVDSDGEFTGCSLDNGGAPATFSKPTSVAVNNAGTVAYVGQFSPAAKNIHRCDINSSTGALTNCVVDNGGHTFAEEPYVVSMNPAGTVLYVGQESPTPQPVIKCDVTPGTGMLANCGPTTYSTFSFATSVTLNAAGTLAYVGSWSTPYIYLCEVTAVSGDLHDCTVAAPSPLSLSEPTQVALNSTGTHLYAIWTSDTVVSRCDVNASSGALSSCINADPGLSSSDRFGFVINEANTFSYLSNNTNDTVRKCSVNPQSGDLSNCSLTGGGFTFPSVAWLTLMY